MTDDEILKVYAQLGSIKATAKVAGVGTQLIRRIIIEHGFYTNDTHNAVSTLCAKGLTPDEIASSLHIGRATVFSYLPHSKGRYMADNPTKNALKIRRTKEKARTTGILHLCRDCGAEIELTGNRGGPPQLCGACKRKREEKKMRTCIVCGAEFSIAGKRGKPPLRCDKCK